MAGVEGIGDLDAVFGKLASLFGLELHSQCCRIDDHKTIATICRVHRNGSKARYFKFDTALA